MAQLRMLDDYGCRPTMFHYPHALEPFTQFSAPLASIHLGVSLLRSCVLGVRDSSYFSIISLTNRCRKRLLCILLAVRSARCGVPELCVSPPSHTLWFARATTELSVLAGGFRLGRAFHLAERHGGGIFHRSGSMAVPEAASAFRSRMSSCSAVAPVLTMHRISIYSFFSISHWLRSFSTSSQASSRLSNRQFISHGRRQRFGFRARLFWCALHRSCVQ